MTAPAASELAPPRLNSASQSLLIWPKSVLAEAIALATASPGVPVAGATVQAASLQPRLVTTGVSVALLTGPRRAASARTFATPAFSAAETSVVVPPAVTPSRIVDGDAARASVSTTHCVRSPSLPVVQPSAPSWASPDTAVSRIASVCSSALVAVATVRGVVWAGSKPSSCVTAAVAWAALAAVTPPLACSAAETAISLKGVRLAVAATSPDWRGV